MVLRLARYVLLAALSLACGPPADEASVRPGVNDAYVPEKVQWYAMRFSRDGREVADHKADILKVLELSPGKTVADIGSGTGLYTLELSRAVGASGRVFAVDVTEHFLEYVKKRVVDAGLKNVTFVLADPKNVGLPEASVDVALMSNVYHHVEFPLTYMATVRRSLKSSGRLLVVDFRRDESCEDAWVLEHVRAGEHEVVAELETVGFEMTKRYDILDRNYVLEFRKKR